ncbi:MAG TPA: hypothetical protein VM370_11820 [Candidatus Thermoplasmatota archaeon]|nr:hypothetical protein [Candidatus Thermoplasmatota archaeon]
MQRPHITLHYEREFPYPVEVAYAWLTDYADDDHARAGAIIKRRIVVRKELDKDGRPVEFELEGELETLGYKTGIGRAIVKLWPDQKRWQADISGGRWLYDYLLVPKGQHACVLKIDYRFGSKRWTRRALLWLNKPRIRRELDTMWDGFAEAMKKEIK